MLRTPDTFEPLIAPRRDPDPLNYIFHRGALLLGEDGSLPHGDQGLDGIPPERLHAVGLLAGRYCQTAWSDHAEPPPGYQYASLRGLLADMDPALVGVASRAAQISEWARTHQFCGACGARTRLLEGERCYGCACGTAAYPRISPAMMVLIRKGDAILLAQHANSGTKRYTALAGFLEAGETVEEAIHREVMEEVGLKVHNLRYFGSQSWPFPHSLMLAFTADYLSGDIRVDPTEIVEARWFRPDDELPDPPVQHVSVSTVLIAAHRPRRA